MGVQENIRNTALEKGRERLEVLLINSFFYKKSFELVMKREFSDFSKFKKVNFTSMRSYVKSHKSTLHAVSTVKGHSVSRKGRGGGGGGGGSCSTPFFTVFEQHRIIAMYVPGHYTA